MPSTGADAVLSVLGPSSSRVSGTPVADGTRLIVDAMKQHGIRRLVASVTDPPDNPPLTARLMVAAVRNLLPGAYRDLLGTADAVRASGLDWTLVRVGLLRDRPGSGEVIAGHLGGGPRPATACPAGAGNAQPSD